MTFKEFLQQIARPTFLAGIKAGKYDHVIGGMIADHEIGELIFDQEIIDAMLRRALLVATSRIWPWWSTEIGNAKIGAELRIKLPAA